MGLCWTLLFLILGGLAEAQSSGLQGGTQMARLLANPTFVVVKHAGSVLTSGSLYANPSLEMSAIIRAHSSVAVPI